MYQEIKILVELMWWCGENYSSPADFSAFTRYPTALSPRISNQFLFYLCL